MLPFPEQHKEITQQLLSGKFILETDELFGVITKEKLMYYDFFKRTFDYEIVVNSEYIYLKSTNDKDKSTRDFVIFLALLCRELDKEGKDYKEEIDKESFLVEHIANFLTESSKRKEIVESTSLYTKGQIDLVTFLNEWQRRNLLQFVGNGKLKFKFTKAIGLFFDYAVGLANEKLKEKVDVI